MSRVERKTVADPDPSVGLTNRERLVSRSTRARGVSSRSSQLAGRADGDWFLGDSQHFFPSSKKAGALFKALRSLIKQQVDNNARFGQGQCTNPGPDLKTASPVGVNSMSAVVSENTSIPQGWMAIASSPASGTAVKQSQVVHGSGHIWLAI